MLKAPHQGPTIYLLPFTTMEVPMPQYEFYCHACKKTFSKLLTLVEYEESEVLCPHCGSNSVEQSWSAFYAITSRKSA